MMNIVFKTEDEILVQRLIEACTHVQASLEESTIMIGALNANDPKYRNRYGKGDRRKNKKNFNQHFRK